MKEKEVKTGPRCTSERKLEWLSREGVVSRDESDKEAEVIRAF